MWGVDRQKFLEEADQTSSRMMPKGQLPSMMNSVKWRDEVHEHDGGCDTGGRRPQDGRAMLEPETYKWEKACDDVTGAEFEPGEVANARQDEMKFFRKMNAYTR